jgi:hypothetical protein
MPGEVFDCCAQEALDNIPCNLRKAVRQLSSADAPAMREVLAKLQEYDARFETDGMQERLQRPIAALQKVLAGTAAIAAGAAAAAAAAPEAADEEDDKDDNEDERSEEDEKENGSIAAVEPGSRVGGYQGNCLRKRQRTW